MKKILLTIALVASMAFSTVASAAVNYKDATDISSSLAYADGVLDVNYDVFNASSTKDVTLVVAAGVEPEITQSNIMYIDQIDMPAAADTSTFQDLGLLIPENTTTATVIINNGGVALLTGTVSVEEEPSNPGVKFVFGDVNGGVYTGTQTTTDLSVVNAADSLAILNVVLGKSAAQGGAYDIGTIVTDNSKKFVFGDVNGGVYTGTQTTTDTSVVNAADSLAILNVVLGKSAAQGGAYDIGTIVTAK